MLITNNLSKTGNLPFHIPYFYWAMDVFRVSILPCNIRRHHHHHSFGINQKTDDAQNGIFVDFRLSIYAATVTDF